MRAPSRAESSEAPQAPNYKLHKHSALSHQDVASEPLGAPISGSGVTLSHLALATAAQVQLLRHVALEICSRSCVHKRRSEELCSVILNCVALDSVSRFPVHGYAQVPTSIYTHTYLCSSVTQFHNGGRARQVQSFKRL